MNTNYCKVETLTVERTSKARTARRIKKITPNLMTNGTLEQSVESPVTIFTYDKSK